MTKISTYTKYLPPILWSPERDPTQFLARMLCIFEEILTGIPSDSDEMPVEATNYIDSRLDLSADNPLAKIIDKIPQLFNPWRTPPEFLPWLASWVGLELEPEWLELEPEWNEYQQRKFISDILSIYLQRGTKQGLLTYLDIYSASESRPRIAIDDGEAVFRAKLTTDSLLQLKTMAYSRVVGEGEGAVAVLLHPTAIAIDRDNNYIIADRGSEVENQWQPALWKMSSTGEIPYQRVENSLPVPKPIYSGEDIENPTAIVIDEQNRYYLLCSGQRNSDTPSSKIYFFDDTNSDITIENIEENLLVTLDDINPVDMVLNNDTEVSQQFIVLGINQENSAKLVVVDTNPLTVEEHLLETVVNPRALIQDIEPETEITRLIIAVPEQLRARANLLRVDPNDNWSVTSMLNPTEENPLIFPTGLVLEDSETILVCDTGIGRQARGGDPSYRFRAEPAAIYRVNLSRDSPQITQITNQRKLVYPTKIAIDHQGDLLVIDRGYSSDELEWRDQPNEFGVWVLFSQERPTEGLQRNKIRFDITNIIDTQKPAHTSWSMRSDL